MSPQLNFKLHGVTVASEIALPGVRRSAAPGGASLEISRDGSDAQADNHLGFFHHWRINGTRGRPWLSALWGALTSELLYL